MSLLLVGLTVVISFVFLVHLLEKNMRKIYRKVDEKSFHFWFKFGRKVTHLKRTWKRTVETCFYYIWTLKRKVENHVEKHW